VIVELRESPDGEVYVSIREGEIRRITPVCYAMVPVDSYEEWRRNTMDLLERSMAREESRVKRMALLWPKGWTGLTPQGIDRQGPTWEDAEWLG
jgi:hypothetical protein